MSHTDMFRDIYITNQTKYQLRVVSVVETRRLRILSHCIIVSSRNHLCCA